AERHCLGEYLIFCDGDTILRKDFVESHLKNARPKAVLFKQGYHPTKYPEWLNRLRQEHTNTIRQSTRSSA
ncbi:MAG: hypothetical protein ABGW75_03600, partial [Pirellulales bacterium]